ncbi:MAG: thioredoxin domain-containing protein [Bacteroidia bacterium]|nr:thioredoxin domain-containing protein [Bacteroidia bacterium]
MPDTIITREKTADIPDLSTLPQDGGSEFNRLVFTSSPYLLQHARNPVDWYPWGNEAFDRALHEDKPVFLSIGYSTCHWCHVMEHESFEDISVATLLNEHYIAIKVDREERPDIDHIYMTVCQAMTGSGGWPLSVFLTPDKLPFFAGTYYPREDRHGRPGFIRILKALHDAWKNERHRVTSIGTELRDRLRAASARNAGALPADMVQLAVRAFTHSYDSVFGGFGNAPKFPMGHTLSFLLRRAHAANDDNLLAICEHTLRRMYDGGIWDHLGGGFCRYSTDRRWLVPHFEKMLYNNALLLMTYAEAWAVTRNVRYEQVCRGIAAYVREYMTDASGVFFSAENADSEGEEGRFYVFTRQEFRSVVGSRYAPMLCEYFGVEEAGNFEHGTNILHIAVDRNEWEQRHGLTPELADSILAAALSALKDARAKRVHPSLDDKILTSWNGLMIAGLAMAGRILRDDEMLQSAVRAADTLLGHMITHDRRLLHRLRGNDAGISGFLEDYTFLIWGLIELHQATLELRYLEQAVMLAEHMLLSFEDDDSRALRFSARDGEALIADTIDLHDGAIPSGNGAAAYVLVRLARITGRVEFEQRAEDILKSAASSISAYPTGSAVFLMALDLMEGESVDLVLSGGQIGEFLSVLDSTWNPRMHVLHRPEGEEAERLARIAPFTAALVPKDGKTTAYVCRNFACDQPVMTAAELRASLAL